MEEQPQTIPGQEDPQATEPQWTETSAHLSQRPLPPPPNVAARHKKRLTLNFPIGVQTPNNNDISSPSPSTMRSMNSPSVPSPARSGAASPSRLPEPSTDSYPILTAIATQERKVLELREELQKAETELISLKKQWVTGEKGRKKTEIVHRAEAMKPMGSAQPSPQRETGSVAESETDTKQPEDPPLSASQARLSREARRQSSIGRLSTDSQPGGGGSGGESSPTVSAKGRTVFHSSRHARTLSLLSGPNTPSQKQKQSFPQPKDVGGPSEPENEHVPRHPRSATLPSMERAGEQENPVVPANPTKNMNQQERAAWRRSLPPIAQDPHAEALVRTGRQMATDFRDGLWTFFEDIRQATVGDEAIRAMETRSAAGLQASQHTSSRKNGVSSAASRERAAALNKLGNNSSGRTPAAGNMDLSFWSEFGIDTPEQTPSTAARATDSNPNQDPQKGPGDPNPADFDDNWDDWDTAQPKTHTPSSSSSTFPKRDQSPLSTNASSPRTSMSITDTVPSQNDPAPGHKRSDSLPWPALNKLHPSKLTRTASTLMAEWEKSLTPPNERASEESARETDKEEKTN